MVAPQIGGRTRRSASGEWGSYAPSRKTLATNSETAISASHCPSRKWRLAQEAGAFGQVPRQDDFWFCPARRAAKIGRPHIPAMMAMHDLDFFAANPMARRDRMNRSFPACAPVSKNGTPNCVDDRRERAAGRSRQADALAEFVQFARQFDALVVGAAAGEKGIQMQHAQFAVRGEGFMRGWPARCCSTPCAQRIFLVRIVSARRCHAA
jgi:hypothetical protein